MHTHLYTHTHGTHTQVSELLTGVPRTTGGQLRTVHLVTSTEKQASEAQASFSKLHHLTLINDPEREAIVGVLWRFPGYHFNEESQGIVTSLAGDPRLSQ